MSGHSVPLNELNVAVQHAVKQALGKHGAVPIDQLWVGFVAPESIATEEAAGKVAAELGKGVHGHVQPSVQSFSAGGEGAAARIRIIGLVYEPKV